ncbi:MAG: thioredoxin domain-containing protein [Microscillaceae bacterium]
MASHQNINRPPNRLAQSTSPYLLQHAFNPVDWFPWGEEALAKARQENKPIIVSIGYSACHWCHVMERESFENEQIATLMNRYFVNIKVDREERPDVDAIYMDAVQAMGVQGGWPLNAFLMPDGRPFYAGTYFPPQNWASLCQKVADIFAQNYEELSASAEQFRQTIARSELEKYGLVAQNKDFLPADLDAMFEGLAPAFDHERGGMQKAPKFPMPSIYRFLLDYAHTTPKAANRQKALAHVEKTLQEMAWGGIYDQIGGGFARYSVDAHWFAPHFEKMLYDNGQLIGLYAQAYQVFQNPLFKQVVYETIDFVNRELTSPEGGFYAALDADSEGVEGKFYTWTSEELESLFPDEAKRQLFAAYYHTTPEGNWEHGYNILYRREEEALICHRFGISETELQAQVQRWKSRLLALRQHRVRPGLDDKILTAWNALMLKGLVEAYQVFGEARFLEMARHNAHFLWENLISERVLYRTYKNGQARLMGYLEDYALLIDAFTSLYEATFALEWLTRARQLTTVAFENFYDPQEGFFFFTDARGEALIARKKEIFDNVIPSSNAVMAKALFRLGLMSEQPLWTETARQMLAKMQRVLLTNVEYLTYWAQLYCLMVKPMAEVVIIGPEAQAMAQALSAMHFYPHKVLLGDKEASEALPLLQNRSAIGGETTFYVCQGQVCQLPVQRLEAAWAQIEVLS